MSLIKRFFIKTARLIGCVVLGVTLGLALPLALEQFTPGYKYYAEAP